MTIIVPALIPSEDVKMNDLLEDRTGVWRPVTHIENPHSSGWFYFRIAAQEVRMAMRGNLILVGRGE